MKGKKLLGIFTIIGLFMLISYGTIQALPYIISLAANKSTVIMALIALAFFIYGVVKFLKWCFN